MALTGDLGSIDLANVFQMLQLSQKTGTLEVRSRGGRTEVYLDGENVLYPFDRDAFPQKVIKLLERCGTLSPELLAKAQASQGILQRDLFAMLLQMKALAPEDITAAYREQMEEEIYELFVDRDATFEFREEEKPSIPGKVIDERYKLAGSGLIMEAARRLDEWGFIRQRVPSDLCVFEMGGTVEQVPEPERDGATLDVVAALDGLRSIAAIVEHTALTRFIVCKKLALLAEMRVVYEVPLEVMIERARQCLREQKSDTGLKLLERAFELGANDAAVHEMAALANQALEKIGAACGHYALVAESLERAGERRGAAEVHLRIRDLMPTDVKSRERLVHHWLDDPDFFKDTSYSAEVEALELVVILKEVGRNADARELLLEVKSRFKEDARVITRLADLSLELGDPKIAVDMLLETADDLFKRRQEASALRLYRRVRTIDPGHDGLEMRIESCEHVARRGPAREGRRGPVRLAVSFVILAALGGVFAFHNRDALTKLSEIPTEELALAGDFDAALATLDAFRTEHPITLAAALAGREMKTIEERARVAEEEATKRTELLAQERGRRQRNAEKAYAEALDLVRRGEHRKALERFERAAELATDPQFLAEKAPATKAQEIREHLRGGQELIGRFETARRHEDWQGMHDVGLEILHERSLSPDMKQIVLPVRITIDPVDADLVLTTSPTESKKLRSGEVVMLPAGSEATLSAMRTDRYPLEVKIKPEAAFDVPLRLDRRADQHLTLPTRVLYAPAIFGDRAFLGCADGRVIALNCRTLATEWQHTLADLEEVGGPPEFDGQGLRVPTRSQKVVWLDAVTGDEIFKQADVDGPPGRLASLEVRLPGGGTLTADADGHVVLRDASGSSIAAWRADSGIEWGVACPGGALFGGGTVVLRLPGDPP
jgi:tetratricopeptide (TPR) repeat protein